MNMTEKKLLSKETFIDLFNMSEIEKIEKEDELFLESKRLGIEKRFKESLKKYQNLLKDKISVDSNLKLPKSKYNIENYNMGGYVCTIKGIKDKNDFKFSYIPILPVERYVNEDTGKEKVKIIFYKENEWKEKIVDRSQLAISSRLLS